MQWSWSLRSIQYRLRWNYFRDIQWNDMKQNEYFCFRLRVKMCRLLGFCSPFLICVIILDAVDDDAKYSSRRCQTIGKISNLSSSAARKVDNSTVYRSRCRGEARGDVVVWEQYWMHMCTNSPRVYWFSLSIFHRLLDMSSLHCVYISSATQLIGPRSLLTFDGWSIFQTLLSISYQFVWSFSPTVQHVMSLGNELFYVIAHTVIALRSHRSICMREVSVVLVSR